MRPHQLAKLLGAYEIKSRTLRDGDVVFRGYPRDRLDDAIERYLVSISPISRATERYNVTSVEKAGENELFGTVTDPACNASKKAGDANESGACNAVTAETEGETGVEENSGGEAAHSALTPEVDDASNGLNEVRPESLSGPDRQGPYASEIPSNPASPSRRRMTI
jgi:hypothetical protein